jgi:CRISPR/Cas system-associated exonuclease Cas4 (RecB family)
MLKDFLELDRCDVFFYKRWFERVQTEGSEVMLRGLLFETLLVGSSRGGAFTSENYPKLKNGGKTKAEKDLEELIEPSQAIMEKLGIKTISVQPEWKHEDLVGHPDLIAEFNGEQVIIDIKYTETKEDDRFNGWGAPEHKDHLQAVFYRYLSKRLFGRWMPFYYLIFGKSGWSKLIRIDLDLEDGTINLLDNYLEALRMYLGDLPKMKVPITGTFSKCSSCPFKDDCEHRAEVPEIQIVTV